jgi:hypothetical protein
MAVGHFLLRRILPTLAVLAILAFPAAIAHTDPLAVIASVKGKVEVSAKGKTTRAGFGRPLESGDKVVVGPGGSASVFFNDGNVIELSEKSSITIGGKVAKPGAASAAPELPGDVYANVSKFVTSGSRQTGLVAMANMRSAGEQKPIIIGPRNTVVMDGRPTFSWFSVEGATRYRVAVTGDAGEAWNSEAEGDTVLPYPKDATGLEPGADYVLEVEALNELGPLRKETCVFHVLSSEGAAAVRANIDRIGESTGSQDNAATHFLAGSYLFGLGLYKQAADQFEALARLSPNSPAPHDALGTIYRAQGLMELAAAEFKTAYDLSKP